MDVTEDDGLKNEDNDTVKYFLALPVSQAWFHLFGTQLLSESSQQPLDVGTLPVSWCRDGNRITAHFLNWPQSSLAAGLGHQCSRHIILICFQARNRILSQLRFFQPSSMLCLFACLLVLPSIPLRIPTTRSYLQKDPVHQRRLSLIVDSDAHFLGTSPKCQHPHELSSSLAHHMFPRSHIQTESKVPLSHLGLFAHLPVPSARK